jgi:hypothetical protein
VGDEFRIIVGGCEGAPAGVGVLVVLDAFFNFGTALETVRLLAMAEHVKPLLVVGVGYRPATCQPRCMCRSESTRTRPETIATAGR